MDVDVKALEARAAASSETDCLKRRIANLLDLIEDIAMIADGHRKSVAQDADGNNIALSVILVRAAEAIGRSDRLSETGAVFAAPGSIVFGS